MRDLDLDKPCEDIDYQMRPATGEDGAQTWEILILRAPFDSSVIRFKNIALNGEGEDANLSFNFVVVETSDPDVVNTENVELQEFAADVLKDVIERALREGWLKSRETDDDGNQSTADDSTESTD